MCSKDLSIEGAVVPGLLLCSMNNSALYWKVFNVFRWVNTTLAEATFNQSIIK